MNNVFISLGSNIGNSVSNLNNAVSLIGIRIGKITSTSSLYKTAPWKMQPGTPDFINQVIEVDTQLLPEKLMDVLLDIEKTQGRIRTQGNNTYESRIIDIDVLFYNNEQLNTDKITVPHPFLYQRKFVLEPLAEIAPLFVHPVLKKTIESLLAECTDLTVVEKTVLK